MASDSPDTPVGPRISLGQVLAAASVVLSLLFVAYEIRQNTAVARIAAAQAFTQHIIDLNQVLIADDMSELNSRILEGAVRSEFTPSERFKLDMAMLSLLRVWESSYRGVEAGILDREVLDPIGGAGPSPFGVAYFLESWPNYRGAFTEDFASYFEEQRGL